MTIFDEFINLQFQIIPCSAVFVRGQRIPQGLVRILLTVSLFAICFFYFSFYTVGNAKHCVMPECSCRASMINEDCPIALEKQA
jgi:hypothetical protein